jgi:archaellum component FlaG (FlaF/FlaG flagellin family)
LKPKLLKLKLPQTKISILITALFLIALVLTLTTYGALNVRRTLSSSGSITVTPNLSIYSDSACTNSLSTIDWGTITPGNTVTKTLYVKNTGSGTSLTLSMSTSNWNPTSANGPVTLSWDREGTQFSPGQSIKAVITLTASPGIADITNFNVQIIITGSA